VNDVRSYVRNFRRQIRCDRPLNCQVSLLHVSGPSLAVGGVDTLAETRIGHKRNRLNRWSLGENKGRTQIVLGPLLNVLNEWKLGRGEWRGNTRLIDEDDSESGTRYGFRRQHVGKTDSGRNVVVVQFTGAVRKPILAEIVQLLRGKIKDRALVGLFGRREMQRVSGADVQSQARGEFPIVLRKEFKNAIARPDPALLQIDLECVHLAKQKTGDGVPAIGNTLLIGPGSRKREGAGRIGRRHCVQLVPAKIKAKLELMRSSRVRNIIDRLPRGSLVLRERAGGRAKLLKSREGEERQGIVECRIGGNSGNA